MKRILFTFFFLASFIFSSEASHLVGGDITYECLGSNQYRFTLNVYRDCASSGPGGGGTPTPFDANASFTIFTGNGTVFTTTSVAFSSAQSSVINIDLSNPCLIPPAGVCVDQATYTGTVTLPFNSLGYFIVYQRCCRNGSISNIGNPSQTGATYSTFISSAGQIVCNNNPTFSSFPPIVICQNQPIDFDHSATDVDGDSLVYSFCAPSVGGGPGNAIPNPASPPPYGSVSFLAPYTATTPLASNVAINPTTGMITGSPTTLGQYVVGICVDEYRNGSWIGSIKRDFQFNVTSCAVSVVADITSDSTSNNGTYFVEQCVDSTVTFDNQSGQLAYIDNYLWEFNLPNGSSLTSAQRNPTMTFPGPGSYFGSMIVNPNSTQCSDTAYVFVKIYDDPIANFSYTYDSCVIGPINFLDNSTSVDGAIRTWDWNFGDDSTMLALNPSYQYQDAGTFNVRLLVTDENGCSDSTVSTVTWAPTPIIDVVPSTASGCIPLDVVFENNSYPINGYSMFWTLGDGYTSTDSDPMHTYQDTGLYTATVHIVSPLGCTATDTFINIVNVRNPPSPNFYFLFDSCSYSPVEFYNTSTNGDGNIIQWDWYFENDSTISSSNDTATYQYADVGQYNATLLITDDNDCEMTITKEIDWQPAPVFPVDLPEFVGCEPLAIEITDNTYPIDGYFTLWNLGDNYYSDNYNVAHTYEKAGNYDLSLKVISKTNCVEDFFYPAQVVVHANPVAEFSFTPDGEQLPSLFQNEVTFTDESNDAVAWNWTFSNEGTSIEQNPIHYFQDTGLHLITLEVEHPTGCRDTISRYLDVKPSFTYYLPNSFTPNDDGKNDGYRGVGEMFGVTSFNLQIWSRWGEKMFETTDPLEAWNGRLNNTGQMVESGVYVCVATIVGPRGEVYEYKTFATVIR